MVASHKDVYKFRQKVFSFCRFCDIMVWVMKMDKEKELPKRKPTRLKNFDYSSAGAYFITICIKDRKRILSDIIKPVGVGAFDDPLTPQIQLTEIGKITKKIFIIKSDHIHVIIFLYPDEYASHKDGSSRAPTPTKEMLPHIVSAFKRFCNKEIGNNIFQRGYIEHIIRDREDYETRAKYIYENPIRWYYDELYTEK